MKNKRYPPLLSGLTYHILNQGNNGETIFKEERNYAYFLKKYRAYFSPIAQTLAYCLLPNHFHLLIKFKDYGGLHTAFPKRFPKPPADLPNREKAETAEHIAYDKLISKALSRHFANFFSGYARAFNNSYGRFGKLFSVPFERILVDNETYFEWLICYLHRNPIHHGFCQDFQHWPHSSFLEISKGFSAMETAERAGRAKTTDKTTDSTLSTVSSLVSSLGPPSLPSPLCDLDFLISWFGSNNKFKKAHYESLQSLLENRYKLE